MIFPLPVVIFTTLLPISLCATTTTVSTSQQGPVVSSDYTDSMAFRNAVLNGTNTYRRQHNATALKWNETLAEYAEKWSDRCFFNHSEGPYGENLASGYPNGTASIAAWGDERQSYSFSSGEFSKKTGHFTQLVWKATTSVGCSRTNCTAKGDGTAPGWYVICEYWPRGNVIGQFADNVQSRVKDPDPAESYRLIALEIQLLK
ncbi:PR-1-like protein [Delitschia confertaspora ATCC 74209]|uniref:PR-1-like protein n=1 Tax=Delitschia confertaspora ATCC 74209 TaxID=1513339 RepID=A0A9P4JRJ1_9PLEO|nr:PR-1-like protein [Delitschia confertaspora ATCC 74209]